MSQLAKSSRYSDNLRFADFTVDTRAGKLRRNGIEVRLQDQPFQILAHLTQRAGEVVTRDELRRQVWPSDTFVDFDNSLNTAINKIREALRRRRNSKVHRDSSSSWLPVHRPGGNIAQRHSPGGVDTDL